MSSSADFERTIARIHGLIEAVGTIITWNDTVFGEADPERERQVDITIKRDDSTVHVECRMHSRPQDVGWIEQLIGRRTTLNADAMIAVSSSGFTEGALKTASHNGIVVRDLLTLTEQEIATWGSRVDVLIRYLRYKEPCIYFIFEPSAAGKVLETESVKLSSFRKLLGDILYKCSKAGAKIQQETEALIQVVPENMSIAGYPVKAVLFGARIVCFQETAKVSKVEVFGDAGALASNRNVYIQTMQSANIEIGRMDDKSYVILDFSTVSPPLDAQFRDIIFDMGKPGLLTGFEIRAQRLPSVELSALKVQNLFGDSSTILNQLLKANPNMRQVDSADVP